MAERKRYKARTEGDSNAFHELVGVVPSLGGMHVHNMLYLTCEGCRREAAARDNLFSNVTSLYIGGDAVNQATRAVESLSPVPVYHVDDMTSKEVRFRTNDTRFKDGRGSLDPYQFATLMYCSAHEECREKYDEGDVDMRYYRPRLPKMKERLSSLAYCPQAPSTCLDLDLLVMRQDGTPVAVFEEFVANPNSHRKYTHMTRRWSAALNCHSVIIETENTESMGDAVIKVYPSGTDSGARAEARFLTYQDFIEKWLAPTLNGN